MPRMIMRWIVLCISMMVAYVGVVTLNIAAYSYGMTVRYDKAAIYFLLAGVVILLLFDAVHQREDDEG